MRRVPCVATAAALLLTGTSACSPALRRPVTVTEDATDLQQVTRSRANETDPAVSPDASELAYEVADRADAVPRVEVMALRDAGAPGARPVFSSKDTPGREPAWKPDGTGLVFVSDTGAHGLIQTVGPSAAGTNFLSGAGNPSLFAAWPSLSPTGAMAMTLGRADVYQSGWRHTLTMESALGISDVAGSGVTVVGEGTDPAWSPRGDRLAFVRVAPDHHGHVFVASKEGMGATQITDGPDDDMSPTWSPDGQYVAFCSVVPLADGTASANLFVVRADGSELRQLTEGDRVACRPSWGRDGFVYFHANADDRFHIWRLRPAGLTSAGTDAPAPGPP